MIFGLYYDFLGVAAMLSTLTVIGLGSTFYEFQRNGVHNSNLFFYIASVIISIIFSVFLWYKAIRMVFTSDLRTQKLKKLTYSYESIRYPLKNRIMMDFPDVMIKQVINSPRNYDGRYHHGDDIFFDISEE